MSQAPFTPHRAHNVACETATMSDCRCQCRGAGHQYDLVKRAVTCADATELEDLQRDLVRTFGGFHHDVRDIDTPSRGSRHVPLPNQIAFLRTTVGWGATWYETLLVDEALHASFIGQSTRSCSMSVAARQERSSFTDGITQHAISLVGSPVLFSNVIESHVWCSLVSEFVATLAGQAAASTATAFCTICYPRKTTGRRPSSIGVVHDRRLAHLGQEFTRSSLPPADKLSIVRLVGAATCPDLWRHPAAVRHCVLPVVQDPRWPPPRTTSIADTSSLGDLAGRWSQRGNW